MIRKKRITQIKLIRNRDIAYRKIKNITILRHLQGENYYLLNELGSRVWELFQSPKNINECFQILLKEYEVDKKKIEVDITNLIMDLLENKLIFFSYRDYSSKYHKKLLTQETHIIKDINIYREISKRIIPLEGMIEITHRCNLRCPHCYLQGAIQQKEMSFRQVQKMLDDLANNGVLFLIITGGEPLLRRDFSKIITYAREKGFIMGLFTNGTLLSKEIVSKISKLKFNFIRISLYGDNPEISDEFTKVEGAFRSTLKGIKYCRDQGINIIVQIVITKHNFHRLSQMVNLCNDLGIPYRISGFITPTYSGNNAPIHLRLDRDSLKTLFKFQIRNQKNNQINVSPSFINEKDFYDKLGICSAGIRTFVVLPNGDIYPCFKLRIKAGNIRKQNFGIIWQKSKVLNWLRGLKSSMLQDCRKCELKDFCKAKCPGLALMETGNIFKASLTACFYSKLLYEVYQEEGEKSQMR